MGNDSSQWKTPPDVSARMKERFAKREQKPKTNWRSVTTNTPPSGEYVLIKTVTGLVRIAKHTLYNNSTETWSYGSHYFKNVMWWQPLPN